MSEDRHALDFFAHTGESLVHRFLNNWTKDAEYFFQSAIQKM